MPDSADIPDSGPLPVVLIVDDESALADNFRLALSGRYEVYATTSPETAIAYCESLEVRLVLTDYRMDGMNGIELVQQIRAIRPGLPCILFSGGLTTDIWSAALNSGCRHVLAKPISLRRVIDLCSRLLTPESAPPVPSRQLDVLESIPWQGGLGRAMRALASHLLSNRNLVYLVSSGGSFPIELLHGLLPGLVQQSPLADPAPGDAPLYTVDLQNMDEGEQDRLATQLGSRHGRTWLISADAAPDDLFDRQKLNEALYYRLGQAVVFLPPPGDCPYDSVQLCTWWLATRSPADHLTEDALEWLKSQVASLDWTTLVALFIQAIKQNYGEPLDASALRRAALSISLGSDLSQIGNYAEFADAYTRKFRQAWDLLRPVA
jgi:CheY-like chemotaxis protein